MNKCPKGVLFELLKFLIQQMLIVTLLKIFPLKIFGIFTIYKVPNNPEIQWKSKNFYKFNIYFAVAQPKGIRNKNFAQHNKINEKEKINLQISLLHPLGVNFWHSKQAVCLLTRFWYILTKLREQKLTSRVNIFFMN